jgi:cytidine deaminase
MDYEEFANPEDMSQEQRALILAARDSTKDAYAPYSSFNVGAAVLLENGKIIKGSNQENAAYPSGLCAERVALFYAGAEYPDVKVKAIAIAAMQEGKFLEEPVSPCGGCRQVLHETEVRHHRSIEIILYGSQKIWVVRQGSDLLPLPFTLDL